MVRTVLMVIAARIVNNDLESSSAYTIIPTPAGTKNTAMFLVMTRDTSFTLTGLIILKNKHRKSNIMPSTLPGIKP